MRIGRWQLSLEGLVLVAVLAFAASWVGRCSGEQDGSALADLDRLEAENDSLKRVQRRVDTLYQVQRDTFLLRRTRIDTLVRTVEHWKHDTTEVVRFVVQAESTIAACTALVVSCDERVRLRDQRIALSDRALKASEALRLRPWTSAGVVYDPVAQQAGVYVDRDVWRLRVGASLTPKSAQLRAGVRW
jgi:hypothetical protein